MSYNASDIQVFEGVDAVRKRPGMYIGGTGPDGFHHLLWEIVDNACDEAMGGHASTIQVTLAADGRSATVDDNGRGIPVDEHPTQKRSALEVILTTLHAGGKFGGSSYGATGGLHGVGSSVVNALSVDLEARVRRDGKEWAQAYRRGRPRAPVAPIGPARGTGTRVSFTPDPSVFGDLTFDAKLVRRTLEVKSYLLRGVRFLFRDQASGEYAEFRHEGGVADYLRAQVAEAQESALLDPPFELVREGELHVELALTWTEAARERVASFVNGIPTPDGGTHEQGLRDALVKALRSFIETFSLAPRGLALSTEDLREGLVAVLSVRLREPQFQGQTKTRLNNPEVRTAVDNQVRASFDRWLIDNRTAGEALVGRAVQAARARLASRQAAAEVRRKTPAGVRVALPGKLADCASTHAEECELFLVEGDSAGGSAKQGRDRRVMAILPLRGKVLNAEQANLKKVLSNEELNNVILAMGGGVGESFREEKLRYGKVILLMDADSDGHHIATLLLAFFYRHLRPLLELGYVYLAQPPLYRIQVGTTSYWARDDADRDRLLATLPSRAKPEITRFKGLGEMPPKVLFETTLDPARRRLLQVTLPDAELAERTMSELLGKDPAPRYRLVVERGAEIEELDV
jgi:DNA gyrase subunit B/topoisomerase-4 subunit B